MTNLQRKPTRLPNYNYSTTAYYFITICTVKHKCMFSTIVGEGSSLPNVYDKVELKLTENGNIVDKAIKELPLKYSNINISNYIIMPNHLHMIIELQNGRENPSPTSISQVIGYFKHFTTKQINKGKKTLLKNL